MSEPISFREYLESYGSLTYPVVGVSMLPLLHQDRDLVTVVQHAGRYAPGDVVLYESRGRFILHRVVETRERDYVILGDNCVNYEYGITDADILGQMTRFVRNGKEFSVDSFPIRTYTYLMLHTGGVRIFLKKTALRLRGFASGVKRKLMGRNRR